MDKKKGISEKDQAIIKKAVLANPKLTFLEFKSKNPSVKICDFTYFKYRYKFVSEAGRTDELPIKQGNSAPSSYGSGRRKRSDASPSRPYIRREKTLYQIIWNTQIEKFEKDPLVALEDFLQHLGIKTRTSYEIVKLEKRIDSVWIPHLEIREL